MGMFFGSGPTASPTSIPPGLPSLEDALEGDRLETYKNLFSKCGPQQRAKDREQGTWEIFIRTGLRIASVRKLPHFCQRLSKSPTLIATVLLQAALSLALRTPFCSASFA